MRKGLTREQVKMAVNRTGCEGIPTMLTKWWGEGLNDRYGSRLKELEKKYPDDICLLWYEQPGYEISPNGNPEYRFGHRKDYGEADKHSIGEITVLLPDWEELDAFLEHFPDPYEPGNFDEVSRLAEEHQDKYKVGCWWRMFHERFWCFRGMENLMYDYYDNMEGLRKIGDRLVRFYKVIIDRFALLGCDAIFTSDDLGHQHGPMMSPEIFRELYLPLYRDVISYVHEKGMKFFLHSCGDNTLLMEDLVQAGVDVFHPVQKGCMNMERTAREYGSRMSFLVGMDVQDTMVKKSPEEVRAEVRFLKKTFCRTEGGMLLSMGNGILADAPFENIEAALDEIYK